MKKQKNEQSLGAFGAFRVWIHALPTQFAGHWLLTCIPPSNSVGANQTSLRRKVGRGHAHLIQEEGIASAGSLWLAFPGSGANVPLVRTLSGEPRDTQTRPVQSFDPCAKLSEANLGQPFWSNPGEQVQGLPRFAPVPRQGSMPASLDEGALYPVGLQKGGGGRGGGRRPMCAGRPKGFFTWDDQDDTSH